MSNYQLDVADLIDAADEPGIDSQSKAILLAGAAIAERLEML
jgi:hypothetical protein